MKIKMIVGDIIDDKYYKITKQYEEVSKEEYDEIFYKDGSEKEWVICKTSTDWR